MIQNNQVNLWDPPASTPYTYTWLSKEFDIPRPANFGAFRLKFNANPYDIAASDITAYTAFNNARLPYVPSVGKAGGLNPLNWAALNSARQTPITGSVLPQIKNPIGGSPDYNISYLSNPPVGVNVTVYARDLNSSWNAQYTNTITSETIQRLPAGFKSDVWQVQLIGNANVYSFSMAESPRDLMND
jgi:hypothetical protein